MKPLGYVYLKQIGLNHPYDFFFQNYIGLSCQSFNMAAVNIDRSYVIEVKRTYSSSITI
jgi:hypothetical protein